MILTMNMLDVVEFQNEEEMVEEDVTRVEVVILVQVMGVDIISSLHFSANIRASAFTFILSAGIFESFTL